MLLLDARLQHAQLVDIGARHARGGKLCRDPLERAQRFKEIDDLARRQKRHARAAPGHEFDQPFGGEDLQRLAQRRARNLQLFAQFEFVDPFARGQPSFDDHVAQPFGGLVMQRAPANGDRLVRAAARKFPDGRRRCPD